MPRDAAALAWMANLGCLELHPHPVRAEDLEHPDELRVDLDPMPGVEWPQIQAVARVVQEVLADFGLVGWPKTSGSRGVHVNVRIHRRWSFTQVRRAALALAREVERRAPDARHQQVVEGRAPRRLPRLQPERQGPHGGERLLGAPEARRARLRPVTWDELFECRPEEFTLRTMPARFAAVGDRHAGIDETPRLARRAPRALGPAGGEGLGDAPWPPHYAKGGEPPRVQPSRRRSKKPASSGGPIKSSGRRGRARREE